MRRRLPARRLWALGLGGMWTAWLGCGCGVLEAAVQDSTSRCQRLADKMSLCPDLFGAHVEPYFLAGPGPERVGAVIPPAVSLSQAPAAAASLAPSREVQACAFRIGGSSDACQGAFTSFVDCIGAPECNAIASRCAAPLAQIRAACAALFGSG